MSRPETQEDFNKLLHREGLGVSRGLYMEKPVGRKPDGSVKFEWGPRLVYGGLLRGQSLLAIAAKKWALEQWSGTGSPASRIGEYARICASCGEPFVSSRSDKLTCSNKCRKRLSRSKKVTLNSNSKGRR